MRNPTSNSSTTYEERARRFVANNVLLCQSSLLDLLLKRNDVPGFMWDDVTNLYDGSIDAVEEHLASVDEVTPDEWHDLPFDEREELAREHGFDPEPHEIYEWWVVSSYMAERLSELGQPILDNGYGTWWGRTCTGQSIYLDHVIARLLGDGFVSG